MEFELQNYSCSCCQKDDTKLILEKSDFKIVRCSNCGFVYVNPRVANHQLSEIYKHNYFHNKQYGYTSYEQEKRLRVKNFERWLKDAEQFIPANKNIKALDIGCAAGYCLEVMKAKGWQPDGLELDQGLCNVLQSAGYNVQPERLEQYDPATKYDVITLFDVIEHIPSVDAAFKKLNDLLENDGIVIMVTPDHNSLQRKIFRGRWFQYKPVEHIQYFTKETLSAFAERNGLKMTHHTSCGQYADTQFLTGRLSYYRFPFLSKLAVTFFSVLGMNNRFFYTDTGSLYSVFKKH